MKRILVFLSFALATLCAAQTVPYTKFTLPNGMKVILHEDHSVPMAAVNVWYHVGSKDEPERRTGFAHLFEHLMFMGTERAPTGQFDKLMEGAGGGNNASTGNDRTNYFDSGPSNILPLLLWLEADRMEDLGRMMDQKKLDLQREVVLNERRESENAPYGKADIKITELLFPKGHPYHISVIGLPEDLAAASVSDVKQFFATYYVPNNATMVVAGDFDSKAIRPTIEKLFGTLPRKDDPVHFEAAQPRLSGVIRHQMVDQVQYPRITMAWHSPGYYQPGDAEMDLTAYVLSNGISSRLYQKLIYQDQLATDVTASQDSLKLGSVFSISVTAKPDVALDKIEKAVDEVVADFVKNGPTADELKRQVSQIEFSALSGLQSVTSVADQLNEYEFYFGEPDSFKRDLDRYRNATPESVRSVAAKVLDPNARVILTVLPQSEATGQNPRAEKPNLVAVSPWTPTEPTELTLTNGVKVYYWRRPDLPLMTLGTLFKRGSELDPVAKAGIASLTADMLDEGAGGKSATEYEQALDQLGARVNIGADRESSTAVVSSTTANFPAALSLYADALLRPNFDPKEWERVQGQTIEGLQQALDDPGTVARRLAAITYFGMEHPYGRPISGTLETVDKVTLDDVKADHAAIYQPSDAVMFAAGSMAPDALKAELDKAFGNWKDKGPVPAKPKYTAPTPKPLRVVLVEKPGAVQTVIRFMMPAPTVSDPNRLQLQAIGTILGGLFTSRLNSNLREDKGYTYGAGAGYVIEPSAGYLSASSDVRTDVTGASLQEFLKEFNGIRTGNITADEATKASASMRQDVVQSASTIGGLVGTAMGMYLEGRPYTDLGKDLQTIATLSPAQLNALVKSGVPLDNAVLVLVGDKEQIMKQWKGLSLPEPVVVKAQ